MDPILIYFSLFIGCFVETRYYSILSLAFIASSFRVTEGNLVFETVEFSIRNCTVLSRLSNVFSALKGTHFYILFDKKLHFC